jgi:hypothetical protein
MGGLGETVSISINITTSSVYYRYYHYQDVRPHTQLFLHSPCSNPVDHNTLGISSPAATSPTANVEPAVHGSTKAHVQEINNQAHGPHSRALCEIICGEHTVL